MVGIETVLKDNPSLNVRLGGKTAVDPIPIVLDSGLRIPLDCNILRIHEKIVIATARSKPRKAKQLENLGAKIIHIKRYKNGQLNLNELMRKLGRNEIMSVLIEGGSKVAASAIKNKIVDKVVFFYAPKIVGSEGISMIGELGVPAINKSLQVKNIKMKRLKDEIMIEGYL